MPGHNAANDEHRLPSGFVGYLDTPQQDQVVLDQALTVRGWVLGTDRTVRRVYLRRKRAAHIDVPCQLPRADVALAYPDHGDSDRSGFEAHIDLRGQPAGRYAFDVCAEDLGGRSTVLFSRGVILGHSSRPTLLQVIRSAVSKTLAAIRAGRLPMSPRHWLAALRAHIAEMRPAAAPSATGQPGTGDVKEILTQLYLAQLQCFLDSRARLAFTPAAQPAISIVIVLFNRAELTLRCLRSLLESTSVTFEVILVDNASTDQTTTVLSRLDNVTVLREEGNVGFLRGVNDGVRLARGKHLLLLNNDTEVMPGALDAALAVVDADPAVGAVGARLVLPDGRLQEAGSIIWRDGSCAGYGRGDSPHAPEYQFRRDVDYCSGAFLMTPRALFDEMGGLDDAYQPAYYEEVDYCVRLHKRGLRVVYEPAAIISHFEFASSRSVDAVRMQIERRSTFVEKHGAWLGGQPASAGTAQLEARARRAGGARRILYLDDRVPFDHLGSGFPRARMVLHSLAQQGHCVTLYPITMPHDEWNRVYQAIPSEIEVMLGRGTSGLRAFLDERRGFYDCVIVSRPHNIQLLRSLYRDADWPPAPLIYDAEALFSLREAEARRLGGNPMPDAALRRSVNEEVGLAAGASRVLCVSEQEAAWFREAGHTTTTLAHTVEPAPTARHFADRSGLLFVGALNADSTPNSDSVTWFVREVLPRIRETLATDIGVAIIGDCPPTQVLALAGDGVQIVGRVDDLEPWFDAARVFIAPTRFAAGIPLKILHAAALGLPVVGTSVLRRQLGWTNGVDLMVADTADAFASACCRVYESEPLWQSLRDRALGRVGADYSMHGFEGALAAAVASVARPASTP